MSESDTVFVCILLLSIGQVAGAIRANRLAKRLKELEASTDMTEAKVAESH